jgi:RNA polymerase primary sigma factor
MALSTMMDYPVAPPNVPLDPQSARLAPVTGRRTGGAEFRSERELARGLSAHEESSLIRRAQAGDAQARERIIELNMRLVYSIARRYHCRSMTLDDLVQEGVIGLLTAVDRFDGGYGCRLSTYATHWIRQSITRAIEQHDRLIRLPVQATSELRQLEQARVAMRQKLNRDPDVEELAAECSLAVERVAHLLGTGEPVSLDTLVGPDQELHLGEVAVDDRAPDPEAGTLADAGMDEVRKVLTTLETKERRVIELRYGLTGEVPISLQEMSERLGISREGVRQIEVRALARLRRALRASHWE